MTSRRAGRRPRQAMARAACRRAEIDLLVNAFLLLRPLEGTWPCLWLDQHAIDRGQHREREYHLAIDRLLAVPSQQVGAAPE